MPTPLARGRAEHGDGNWQVEKATDQSIRDEFEPRNVLEGAPVAGGQRCGVLNGPGGYPEIGLRPPVQSLGRAQCCDDPGIPKGRLHLHVADAEHRQEGEGI